MIALYKTQLYLCTIFILQQPLNIATAFYK